MSARTVPGMARQDLVSPGFLFAHGRQATASAGWAARRPRARSSSAHAADRTGNPLRTADVGIREGRIVTVGRITDPADRVLNAEARIVAPGFIDVHTHADDIAELPGAENFVRMGVTTVIAGNCGSSSTDIAAFFRQIETTHVAVNVGVLIGQGSVRSQVMGGSFRRPATPAELDRMRTLVDQGMRDGALGLSTGLIYLPGTFTPTEELVALAKVAGRHGGVYASHMRDEGREILAALDEAFRIGRTSGCRIQISHLKLSGSASWGRTNEVIAAIEAARRSGLDVTQDQYAYTASWADTSANSVSCAWRMPSDE